MRRRDAAHSLSAGAKHRRIFSSARSYLAIGVEHFKRILRPSHGRHIRPISQPLIKEHTMCSDTSEEASSDNTDEAQSSPPNTTDTIAFSKDFHVREWESLRREVMSQIDHTRKLELATIAGLGAFYAWFASAKASSPSHFLLLVPSLLVLLAGLRAWGTFVRIQEIATYIRRIESNFSLVTGGLIGWDRTRKKEFPRSSPFRVSATLFWLAAVGVSILAWLYL